MSSRRASEPEVSKLFYRIGEVASLLDVPTSVLRHWENEFPSLRPGRHKSGQRLYRPTDLRRLEVIKHLLYEKKYTTKGAIQYLREHGLEPRQTNDPVVRENDNLREALLTIRKEVTEFLSSLQGDEAT
ncbi:MAG TPA: MerR family transcriptional regulator [Polyangiaceae bacterium]|nr:MerR family transcriptional regulator [Polyangiaceae bacterium]